MVASAMKSGSMMDPYWLQQQEIERRRRIAEALQAQSMEPLQAPPTPTGGFAVPISPMQGFAKIAQALAGGYGQKRAREETMALGERYGKERTDIVTKALAAGEGSPAQPERWTGEPGEELYTPEKTAVPPDRRKVNQALATSNLPDLQTISM